MKFCKDCQHYVEGPLRDYCRSPKNGVNLVTGYAKVFTANLARTSSFECGIEGRWFELKIEKPTLWQRLTGSKN